MIVGKKNVAALMSGVFMAISITHVHARDLAADFLPELIVVDDRGGIPARPYFVAIGMSGVSEAEGYVTRSGARGPHGIDESDMLPVESPSLTPGYVEARSLSLPEGTTPFFLIGDDELSMTWLQQRGDVLRSLNAVGLAVDVSSSAGLQQIRAVVPEIEIRPVAGDDLAARLGIDHYPVLITSARMEQ